MKVYVITHYDYSDSYVYGVVEDEETAKEMVKRLGEDNGYEEFDTKAISLHKDIIYRIAINKDGGIYFAEPEEDQELYRKRINKLVYKDNGFMTFIVAAKDIDYAKKIACDMRAKYLAEKAGL